MSPLKICLKLVNEFSKAKGYKNSKVYPYARSLQSENEIQENNSLYN